MDKMKSIKTLVDKIESNLYSLLCPGSKQHLTVTVHKYSPAALNDSGSIRTGFLQITNDYAVFHYLYKIQTVSITKFNKFSQLLRK